MSGLEISMIFEVSIPLWFDSNQESPRGKAVSEKRFNSTLVRFKHDGAIPQRQREHRFNSTLVRFKPNVARLGRELSGVSIPLWFDSNRSGTRVLECAHKFQFHSGSIQTVYRKVTILKI